MANHSAHCESNRYYVTTGKWGACSCGYEAEQAEQDALAGQAEAEQAQEARESAEVLWAGYPLTWGDEG